MRIVDDAESARSEGSVNYRSDCRLRCARRKRHERTDVDGRTLRTEPLKIFRRRVPVERQAPALHCFALLVTRPREIFLRITAPVDAICHPLQEGDTSRNGKWKHVRRTSTWPLWDSAATSARRGISRAG